MVLGGEHVNVTDQGTQRLGPCLTPATPEARKADAVISKLSEVSARIRAITGPALAADILAKARATHLELSQSEDDDDAE
jgi:hypothetical protein